VSDPTPAAALSELRIGELATFLAVARARSITRAAREMKTTPSHVSKVITRIEAQLSRRLMRRGARGIELTMEGETAVPLVEAMFESLGRLERSESEAQPVIQIGAPSFLCSLLVPCVAHALTGRRIRGIELAPAALRSHPTDGPFDILISTGNIKHMPPTWSVTTVGHIAKGLLCSPVLAQHLGATPIDPRALRSVHFVTPVYSLNGQYVASDDDCPLPRAERKQGSEAQTIQCALEMAVVTHQAVFGPVSAARRFVEEGSIVEVPVRGWNVRDDCFVAVNPDRVLARVRDAVIVAVTQRWIELDQAPALRQKSASKA
jgi:DNA-binding transcriptional LysR family regulator